MWYRLKRKIYALYKGDEYLMDGTIKEIANRRGVKESSIYFLLMPAYQRRIAAKMAKAKKPSKGYLELVRLE